MIYDAIILVSVTVYFDATRMAPQGVIAGCIKAVLTVAVK
jgi:hypothetical protein